MGEVSENVGGSIMQAVILAAGLGTRLQPFTFETPKPLMPVNGNPFLWHLLNYLRTQTIKEAVICTGYRTHQIYDYIGDGSRFGLKVRYSTETGEVQGTYHTLKKAQPLLDEVFVVINGDTYLELDYHDADAEFLLSKKKGMVVVYGKPDETGVQGNLEIEEGRVVKYSKTKKHDYVDAGVLFLKRDVLGQSRAVSGSIEDMIFQPLIKQFQLAAYESPKRFHDIGTPERWKEFERFMVEA